MPTFFSLFSIGLHLLLALGLNTLINMGFHIEGYWGLTGYFILLTHSHYKMFEKLSKMTIIDPKELDKAIQQEKIKALKPMVGGSNEKSI